MVTHNGLLHTIDYSLKGISIYIPPGVTLSALLPPGTSAGARETHTESCLEHKGSVLPSVTADFSSLVGVGEGQGYESPPSPGLGFPPVLKICLISLFGLEVHLGLLRT